ncbi:MAG TPA: OmpA family protein [Candidatus Kapabacteria bacterium]|nr:OmpA family protein [Candidatus Kapabacteria bacterium]
MYRLIFLLCGVLVIFNTSFSQVENDELLGINISFNNYFNYADFKQLQGVPNCCPRFDFGYDSKLSYALFYRQYLEQSYFFQFDLRYTQLSSKFEATETETFGGRDGFFNGEFTHYLQSQINMISIIPSFAYETNKLILGLGVGLSYFINKHYSQREQITKPSNRGTFLDSLGNDTGSRIRNANSGKLPSQNDFALSVIPRLSYKLPINNSNSIYLEPTISAEINVLKISENMNWRSFNLSAGLSLIFELNKEENKLELSEIKNIGLISLDTLEIMTHKDYKIKSKFDSIFKPSYINPIDTIVGKVQEIKNKSSYIKGQTIIEYDTLVIKKKLTIRKTKFRYDTVFVDSKQEYINFAINDTSNNIVDKINISEIIASDEIPILNRIFYDKNQNFISDSFLANSANKLPYYNLFNVLKERYQASKNKIILRLIATNNQLSNDSLRLELLRKFLVEKLNINDDAIKLNIDSNLSSNNKYSIIELLTDDLIEPLTSKDTIKLVKNNILNLKIDANLKNKSNPLELNIYMDSTLIYSEKLDPQTKDISLDMNTLINKITPTATFLKIILQSDNLADIIANEKIIKINYKSLQKFEILEQNAPEQLTRFLINFEYNSNELDPNNIAIIKNINKNIKQNSLVEVIGYTDDIGNPEFNKVLSLQRAKEVAKYLNSKNINIIGAGINTKYQKLDTPESKIYSRCVEIVIKNN